MPKLRLAICAALAITGSALALGAVATAKPRAPKEPPIAIPRPELEASFHCHGEVGDVPQS